MYTMWTNIYKSFHNTELKNIFYLIYVLQLEKISKMQSKYMSPSLITNLLKLKI